MRASVNDSTHAASGSLLPRGFVTPRSTRNARCHMMVNVERYPNSDPPVVMVVDDEPAVCSSVRRLLRAAGYHVETHCGPERLGQSDRPAGPCCLILDVQMPEVSGLEV